VSSAGLAAGLLLTVAVVGCSASEGALDGAVADRDADAVGGEVGTDAGGDGTARGDGSGDDAAGDQQRERRIAEFDNVPEVDVPELPEPDEVLATVPEELLLAIDEAIESPDVAILDVAGIIDEGPTAAEIAGFGDGNRRTGSGELVVLDERASLACANVELALFALDDGAPDRAADQVALAAERAAASNLTAVQDWAPRLVEAAGEGTGLDRAVDALTLVGFLSLCVEGGYEL
jgi:hypothetical protein